MRILIVNTAERTGGAAVAAHRLMEALNNNGEKARMLVRDRQSADVNVIATGGGWRGRLRFLRERLAIFLRMGLSRKHLFEVDIANAGTDITRLAAFREADVVHLHWINQGFLSTATIRKIIDSGKPVVWTLHDLWPATGICHYPRRCTAYSSGCGHCPYLPHEGSARDLSASTWRRKQRAWGHGEIAFVACSRWLAAEVKRSGLLQGSLITQIPNPIDTRVYRPLPKAEARRRHALPADKRLVLFVSQRLTDPRKGIAYFIDAVQQLKARWPEAANTVGIVMMGSHAEELAPQLALPVYPLGYMSDEADIIAAYSAADLFVTPSLEDNLPNTIMEAMACGLPCVGFNTGGIPEMIDHRQNGYIATRGSATDLADGMTWALRDADHQALSADAVAKVHRCYSPSSVALRYVEVYHQALAGTHYNI